MTSTAAPKQAPGVTPIARSPIAPAPPVTVEHGWEVSARRSSAALTITDLTPLAKVAARAPYQGEFETALGVPFGRSARNAAGDLVICSGPGEWLVVAAPGEAQRVTAELTQLGERITGELTSVVDLTHGRALVRLCGSSSADALAKVCAIDLDGDVTPDGAALRSSVAGVVTDVVRDDVSGVASYLLHCERSSGQYLFDALVDAGTEFGIEIDGFVGRA